jgi:hypothetical protein
MHMMNKIQQSHHQRITMPDLKRIHYLTKHYGELLGLGWLPIGVFFLTQVPFQAGWIETPEWLDTAHIILGSLLSSWLGPLIAKWYERRFGKVKPSLANIDRWALSWGVLFFVVIAGQVVDGVLDPPVSLLCLALAGTLLAFWWRGSRWAWHYAAMALGIAVVGLLPLFTDLSTRELIRGGGSALLLGTIFTVGGIFDHLLLVRTLKRVPEDDYEPAR